MIRKYQARYNVSCIIPFQQCQGYQQTLYSELCHQRDLQWTRMPQPTSVRRPDRRYSVNPQQPSCKTSAVQPSDNRSTRLLAIMDDDNRCGSAQMQPQSLPAPVLIYIYSHVRRLCPSRELLTGIMTRTANLPY